MRSNNRQEVTGIVVNEKPSLDRKTLKRFRALLHQIEKDGPEGKRWGGAYNVLDAVKGFTNYLSMVDPQKGQRFRQQIDRIIHRHGYRSPNSEMTPLNRSLFRSAAAVGKPPREPWWQPAEKALPVMPALDETPGPSLEDARQGNRRTTRELIDEAVAESHQSQAWAGHGFWRRLLGRFAPLFRWLVIFVIMLFLLRISPILAIAFLAAVIYFRSGLRG